MRYETHCAPKNQHIGKYKICINGFRSGFVCNRDIRAADYQRDSDGTDIQWMI